jgi:CRISPR/Cas system-associated exonuclease Cas4 (RecB family)
MSARDLFHAAVRRGLEKEQWHISSDPLELEWEEVRIKIDLAAERLIAAERGEEKIAVEVKSFVSPSPISDFYTALGQFLTYKIMLEVREPDRQLVSSDTSGDLRDILPESLCPNCH